MHINLSEHVNTAWCGNKTGTYNVSTLYMCVFSLWYTGSTFWTSTCTKNRYLLIHVLVPTCECLCMLWCWHIPEIMLQISQKHPVGSTLYLRFLPCSKLPQIPVHQLSSVYLQEKFPGMIIYFMNQYAWTWFVTKGKK